MPDLLSAWILIRKDTDGIPDLLCELVQINFLNIYLYPRL